jgi:hypothetical protein
MTTSLGFVVPDTPWPLIEVGMPPRAAQILVDRAAKHLYPTLSRTDAAALFRRSLRTDIFRAVSGVLEIMGNGRIVLPLPKSVRGETLVEVYLLGPSQRERVLSAPEIKAAYEVHVEQTKAREKRNYYPREDDPTFLDGFYRSLEALIRAAAMRWKTTNLQLALVFSADGKQLVRRLSVGEHSKTARGPAPPLPLEYKSLRNVDLAELPHLLARLASRKKRKGRQLPTVSRTNPMANQDQLKAMLMATGEPVPVPGKPGRVYVYSKRQDAVIETSTKRAKTWQAIGAAGRAASQQLSQAAREAQENPMGRNSDDNYWREQYEQGPFGAQQAVPAARRNGRKARRNSATLVGPVLFTKNGQPYRRTEDGKARFISKDAARSAKGYQNPHHGRAVLNPRYARAATENKGRGKKPKQKRSNPYAKAVFARAKALFETQGCSWSTALRQAHADVKAAGGGRRAAANPWFRSSHVPDLYLPDTTQTRSALVASPFGPDGDLTYVRSALEPGPYGRSNPPLPSGVWLHGRGGHFFPNEENATGMVGPGYDDFDNEHFDQSGTPHPDSYWGGGQRARGGYSDRTGQFSPTGTGGFQPVNRRNPRKKRKAKKNR